MEDVKAFFTDVFAETRGFEGCQSVTLNVDDDGRTFIPLGAWDSPEAHRRAYAVRQSRTEEAAGLTSLLEAPPTARCPEPAAVRGEAPAGADGTLQPSPNGHSRRV